MRAIFRLKSEGLRHSNNFILGILVIVILLVINTVLSTVATHHEKGSPQSLYGKICLRLLPVLDGKNCLVVISEKCHMQTASLARLVISCRKKM